MSHFKIKFLIPLMTPTLLMHSGCTTMNIMKSMGKIKVSPAHYKHTMPMTMPRNESMLVTVDFKKEGISRVMKIDNHAPVALTTKLIENNPAMKRIGEAPVKRKTANGTSFKNVAYITDSVALGSVIFDKVTFFSLPDRTDMRGTEYDGYVGGLMLEEAIWKFDFEKMEVTIASSIDSIPEIKTATKINAKLTVTGAFKVPLVFNSGYSREVEVDLGYNGEVSLPGGDFDKVDTGGKATSKSGSFIDAAGSATMGKRYLFNEPVTVGGNKEKIQVASYSKNDLKLVGLGYFRRYKFVVFDYMNGVIYTSSVSPE